MLSCRVSPHAPVGAQANRAFLRRVVRNLVREAGTRQIPRHRLGPAQRAGKRARGRGRDANPLAQTMLVDNDPGGLHPRAGPAGQDLPARPRSSPPVMHGRQRSWIHPGIREFSIDFRQPVDCFCTCCTSTTEADPSGIMADLRDAMPQSSSISPSPASVCRNRSCPSSAPRPSRCGGRSIEQLGSGHWRSDEAILAWFGDWELLRRPGSPAGLAPRTRRSPGRDGRPRPALRRCSPGRTDRCRRRVAWARTGRATVSTGQPAAGPPIRSQPPDRSVARRTRNSADQQERPDMDGGRARPGSGVPSTRCRRSGSAGGFHRDPAGNPRPSRHQGRLVKVTSGAASSAWLRSSRGAAVEADHDDVAAHPPQPEDVQPADRGDVPGRRGVEWSGDGATGRGAAGGKVCTRRSSSARVRAVVARSIRSPS